MKDMIIMSKKIFVHLLIDLVIVGIVTIIYLVLKQFIYGMQLDVLGQVLQLIVMVLYISFDVVVFFFFLLYWWSDKKWTYIKRKLKKKR